MVLDVYVFGTRDEMLFCPKDQKTVVTVREPRSALPRWPQWRLDALVKIVMSRPDLSGVECVRFIDGHKWAASPDKRNRTKVSIIEYAV